MILPRASDEQEATTTPLPRESAFPCVVFALRRESMDFRRVHPRHQRLRDAPCRAEVRGIGSSALLMLETGVGATAMTTAVRWCLQGTLRPSVLCCVGFSGALQPGQRVGDLVLASEIVEPGGKRWPAFLPKICSSDAITTGRLLTVAAMVSDPREKQRLGQAYQALAVDMESAAAAQLCQQYEVPFVCLRAISDDLNTPLSPQLVDLLRDGRVSLPRLLANVMRHPTLMGELWCLAKNTRIAARKLLAVGSLLPQR